VQITTPSFPRKGFVLAPFFLFPFSRWVAKHGVQRKFFFVPAFVPFLAYFFCFVLSGKVEVALYSLWESTKGTKKPALSLFSPRKRSCKARAGKGEQQGKKGNVKAVKC